MQGIVNIPALFYVNIVRMNKSEVLKLASLSRISISEQETDDLSKEFKAILGYVGEVKEVGTKSDKSKIAKEEFRVRNITRQDELAHQSGIYTEDILKEAPEQDGNYLRVKNIL
jgi:aspartyl/glutamyl-tRNA(Asn/Gln) amidotransferase C subunit